VSISQWPFEKDDFQTGIRAGPFPQHMPYVKAPAQRHEHVVVPDIGVFRMAAISPSVRKESLRK